MKKEKHLTPPLEGFEERMAIFLKERKEAMISRFVDTFGQRANSQRIATVMGLRPATNPFYEFLALEWMHSEIYEEGSKPVFRIALSKVEYVCKEPLFLKRIFPTKHKFVMTDIASIVVKNVDFSEYDNKNTFIENLKQDVFSGSNGELGSNFQMLMLWFESVLMNTKIEKFLHKL